jgi:hypothetical protein
MRFRSLESSVMATLNAPDAKLELLRREMTIKLAHDRHDSGGDSAMPHP